MCIYCHFNIHFLSFFSSLKKTLAFFVIQVWRWLTPLAFSWLGSSLSVLWVWIIALLGKGILVVGPSSHHFEYFVPVPSGLESFCSGIGWQPYGSSLAFLLLLLRFSLSLTICILIMMCPGVGLSGSLWDSLLPGLVCLLLSPG